MLFSEVFILCSQIGSRSSVYSPESSVRKTGSYIYEEFMPTDGTDVKVRKSLERYLPLPCLGELKVQRFCLVLLRVWNVCLSFVVLTLQFQPQRGEWVLCRSHQEECVRPCHPLFCVCSRNTFWKLQLVLVALSGVTHCISRCTLLGRTMPMQRLANPPLWMGKWNGTVKAKKFVTQSC